MRFCIHAALIFYFLSVYPWPASSASANSGYPDYFRTIETRDLTAALKAAGAKSCEEFTKKYFSASSDAITIAMQAAAYDTGLCVLQDLKKAAELYEKIFQQEPDPLVVPLRLALIYHFGPPELQDRERAHFLYKQSVISLSLLPEETRQKAVTGFLNHQPVPEELKKGLHWIEKIMKETPEEKRKISKELQKQGFKNTDFIWNPVNDIKPMEMLE
ncbi:MAG: hypothetical protein IT558_03620 [Alphaproteobacteria bacterium]|nr:hypothetical protein [Alphaproteobacteria bacterium]